MSALRYGLQLLKLFTPGQSRWTVSAAARRLGVSKSTASRLLSTLAAEGFVTRDPETRDYRLGIRCYEIGSVYLTTVSIRRIALSILGEVALNVKETVYLGALGDCVAVYIDKIVSPLSLRVDSHLGVSIPLHATALGKALLAAQSISYVERVIERGLARYTPRTITDPEALRLELASVRERGFATDLEEYEEGLHCIGFPLQRQDGAVGFAFSVAGPSVRLTQRRMMEMVPVLRAAAAAVSGSLSGQLLGPEETEKLLPMPNSYAVAR